MAWIREGLANLADQPGNQQHSVVNPPYLPSTVSQSAAISPALGSSPRLMKLILSGD